MPIKGYALQVFTDRSTIGISDLFVDLADYNGAIVDCYVQGTSPRIQLTIEGNSAPGGSYLPITDINGRILVQYSQSFMVIVGARFAKVRINAISGSGASITVIITPFVHPGGSPIMANSYFAANSDDAVVDLGSLTVWTPTSGARFRLSKAVISTDTSGAYLLRDALLTLSMTRLLANQPFVFDYSPNGYRSQQVNNTLNVRNLTGSTVALRCSAWGLEEG